MVDQNGIMLSPGFDRVTTPTRKAQAQQKIYDPNREMRCPNNHPMWSLYHKKVDNDTIVCCKKCEEETDAAI
jgi:hypothetical protein